MFAESCLIAKFIFRPFFYNHHQRTPLTTHTQIEPSPHISNIVLWSNRNEENSRGQ